MGRNAITYQRDIYIFSGECYLISGKILRLRTEYMKGKLHNFLYHVKVISVQLVIHECIFWSTQR